MLPANSRFLAALGMTKVWISCLQRCGVYCEEVSEILAGKSAIMALNAVEQASEQVPADDFQALEDKIYRTIEMYKAARQAQAAAERDAQRVRQQMQDREEELVTLRRETVRLKKEREEIRGRVEKMLQQIESIAEASEGRAVAHDVGSTTPRRNGLWLPRPRIRW